MIRKIIPSALTLANLTLGFLALVFILKDELSTSVWLICLGLVCDFFDGYFARKFNTISALGKELDSLADLVTFGIAPAFLIYAELLHELLIFGAVCCFTYVCCCALRLARFNVMQDKLPRFIGMPTPLAAVLTLLILASFQPFAASIMLLIISMLMVSWISFPSFKKMETDPKEQF